ncbi:hypothetical protein CONCODRAFT_9942 [Conidiobolus coronatus NRRL 28638]|uniref:Uncharacterized protein n=1 Tax=Conidiobolus coronatus (strain ATCC 28846 / CBS 209.66 / NRRL 28638) TaxID=796925 RepID=A0A137NZ84_CONC2|nr:hypothetical protein CONCODRAFT_9942 [Conidiobolus coronatus NRRL 28638]|eukprot:KXN67909.1 hypothetical protein CONCODRAFT_9942 [Conidiobolus coronatus NRRL 28638]
MKKNFFFKAFESKYAKNKSREVYVFCRKEAILAIIEFIYTGQVDCKVFTKKNYSLILEIYQRAHDYGLTTLKEMIKVFILAYLDESTLSILLGSGILNKEDSFLKKIFNFIPNIINKTI